MPQRVGRLIRVCAPDMRLAPVVGYCVDKGSQADPRGVRMEHGPIGQGYGFSGESQVAIKEVRTGANRMSHRHTATLPATRMGPTVPVQVSHFVMGHPFRVSTPVLFHTVRASWTGKCRRDEGGGAGYLVTVETAAVRGARSHGSEVCTRRCAGCLGCPTHGAGPPGRRAWEGQTAVDGRTPKGAPGQAEEHETPGSVSN